MTQMKNMKPNSMERLMIPIHNRTNIGAEKFCVDVEITC